MGFDQAIAQAIEYLKGRERVTFVSHADADGICATAILQRVCTYLGVQQRTIFLSQISVLALERLAIIGDAVFVDTGSSHLEHIARLFPHALVLDHHQCAATAANITLVNPFLHDMDGTRDICAAGIAFLIAAQAAPELAELSAIAVIGAQADNQEHDGFFGENQRILAHAIRAGTVRLRRGIRLYGTQTRPLVQLIARSYDLQIPALREPKAVERLLSELEIPWSTHGRTRMLEDLSDQERAALEEALAAQSPNPEVRVTHYLLPHMPAGPLRDTREAATLLNSCGRLGKPELAIRMLLGDAHALRDARQVQQEYKGILHDAHAWFSRARAQGDPDIVAREGLVIINARDRMPADLSGTLCSILTRGNEVPASTVVVCLARNGDGTTKVSARAQGSSRDLAQLMTRVAATVGGEGGGHAVAAGAVIPTSQEAAFIDALK